MIRYLIRRLLWAVVLFFAVTIVTYFLFFIIPADPAKQVCGKACKAGDVARIKHELGLDRPIYVQYGKLVWKIVRHGSLGHSLPNRQSVKPLVLDAAPV